MNRHYYAAHSYMGVNFTFDSPCWIAFRFDSKKERDAWVCDGEYNDQGNRVKCAVKRIDVVKILGCSKFDLQPGGRPGELDRCQ